MRFWLKSGYSCICGLMWLNTAAIASYDLKLPPLVFLSSPRRSLFRIVRMSDPEQTASAAVADIHPCQRARQSWGRRMSRILIGPIFRFCRWILLLAGASPAPYRSLQAAIASRNAYKITQDLKSLNDSVFYYRAAQTIHAYDTSEGQASFGLASALLDRFCRFGDVYDLHEAVVVARRALQSTLRDENDCVPARLILAETLRVRYSMTEDIVDLEEAVRLLQQAERLCSPEHPHRVETLTYLARALRDRYKGFRSKEDIERALTLLREAIDLRCGDPSHRAAALECLASALRYHVLTGAPLTELEEAISTCHMALDMQSPTDYARAESLVVLGTCLFTRYERTRIESALTDAIVAHRQALALRPQGHPLRASSLANLGGALYLRCEDTGTKADLDESITCLREASLIPLTSRSGRVLTLLNLATALRLRFISVSGSTTDLDECIELRQNAVALCPSSHHMHHSVLYSLADGLCLRYEAFGSAPDLTESLSLMRSALSEQSPGNFFRSATSCLLGNALVTLSNSHKIPSPQRAESLDEAISVLREANEVEPDISTVKTWLLGELGNALLVRWDRLHDLADLAEAISCHEQAASLESVECTRYQEILRNYAKSLAERFRVSSSAEDALQALDHLKSALVRLPSGTLERPLCLVQLSQLYLDTKTSFHDKTTAFCYLIESLDYPHTSAQTRLSGALKVLEYIQDFPLQEICSDLTLLCDAYARVVRLLPRVAFFGLNPQSRLATLEKAEGIATESAAHAILANWADLALELLEQGRSLFWTQTLRLRTSFDELPDAMREQAISLARVLELESVSSSETDMTERRHLSERFDALLQGIRVLPSFARFMLPEEYSTLKHVATDGPVVVLIGSERGCFALVMRSPNYLTVLPLKEIGLLWLKSSTEVWRVATEDARSFELQENQSRLKMDKIRHRRPQHLRGTGQQEAILRETWEKVVHPVLEELRITPTAGRLRPRLWWCTTGRFAFLPVHAAGIYPDGPCCSDYVVSSYTPTLSALLDARRRHKPLMQRRAEVIIAGVSMSENKAWNPLPYTVQEANLIKTILPPQCLRLLPAEDDILSNAPNAGMSAQCLLTELSANDSASILHLACHGSQNIDNPLQSGFVMRDEVLTISRLLPVPLSNAFFAFLSACETAKGHQEQPDQTVHLAATMLFVGFKSVVATLWNMDDCDGPLVASKIYRDLFRSDAEYLDPEMIPYALDEAAQELRRNGASPCRWAPYIHIGI